MVATADAVHVIHGNLDFYIAIDRTQCNYGGSRPWFVCPQCEDRRAVLYDSGDGFGCRRCLRLVHTSTTEDMFDRHRRKGYKLAEKLGEYGAKPKWMRWGKFDRIQWRRLKAEQDFVRRLNRCL